MSRIVKAINAMISNPDKITKVMKHGNAIYFEYGKKYKWSIFRDDNDDYIMCYYPGSGSLESLIAPPMILSHENVVYSSKDIGTREAYASFRELYTMLNEILYGVNDALDDIIGEDEL